MCVYTNKSRFTLKKSERNKSVHAVEKVSGFETEKRIDDRASTFLPPPPTSPQTPHREREGVGEGRKKATHSPVDILAAQAMKVPIQVFETVKRAKIRVEKRRVV